MGTLSAANGGTLQPGGPDGVVLTSSVTETSRRVHNTVYNAHLIDVTIPTLLVHNREDGCVVCPFNNIPDLLGRFKNAPRKQLITFQGGDPPIPRPARRCRAMAISASRAKSSRRSPSGSRRNSLRQLGQLNIRSKKPMEKSAGMVRLARSPV
jgi:hypothetical protein